MAPSAPDSDSAHAPALQGTASYAGEWRLFADYCAATDQPALPTTAAAVAGFLTAIPARPATVGRRLRAIAAAHRVAGWPTEHLHCELPVDAAGTGQARRRRERAGDLIAGCPTRGWPDGFTGRRDAVLVVLVEVLGHSRDRARRLTPDVITVTGHGLRIGSRAVPETDDPRSCPGCALVRWLEVCDLADGLGRALARRMLTSAIPPGPTDPHAHLPGHQRWREAPWLVTGIDQHGRRRDDEPLSSRAVTARLAAARRRARGQPEVSAPPPDLDGCW